MAGEKKYSFNSISEVSHITWSELSDLRHGEGTLTVQGKRYRIETDGATIKSVSRVDRPSTFDSFKEFFTHRIADGSSASRSIRLQRVLDDRLAASDLDVFFTKQSSSSRTPLTTNFFFGSSSKNPPRFEPPNSLSGSLPAREAGEPCRMLSKKPDNPEVAGRADDWDETSETCRMLSKKPDDPAVAGRADAPDETSKKIDDAALNAIRTFCSGTQPASTPATPSQAEPLNLLEHALSNVCGNDPDRVAAARSFLTDGMYECVDRIPLTQQEQDGWLVAMQLARTTHGFETLRNLRSGPSASSHVTSQPAEAMFVLLQVVNEHNDANRDASPVTSPAALFALTSSKQRTAAPKDAIVWLGHPAAEHARALLGHPIGSSCKALRIKPSTAYFAWRQGYRQDGPGTDLQRTKHRLHKFRVWVSRAEQRQTDSFFDKTLNKLQRVKGSNKTPIPALKYGVMGADLNIPAEQQKVFFSSYSKSISMLESDLHATRAASTTWKVRSEILAYANQRLSVLGQAEVQGCLKLDRRIAREVFLRLSDSDPNLTLADVWSVIKRTPVLDPDTLCAWSEELWNFKRTNCDSSALRKAERAYAEALSDDDGVDTVRAEIAYQLAFEASISPNKAELDRTLAAAKRIYNAGADKLPPFSLSAFAEAAREVYQQSRLGNRVTYSDGGTLGVDLRAGIGIGLPVKFSVEQQFSVSRNAKLEFGSSSLGGIFSVGSEKKHNVRTGARISVGSNLVGPVNVGVSAGAARAISDVDTETVVVRTPTTRARPGSNTGRRYTDDWRELAADFSNFMFRPLEQSNGTESEDDMFDSLVDTFGDTPISINLQTTLANKADYSVGASAQARVFVGPSAGLSRTKTIAARSSTIDHTGTIRSVGVISSVSGSITTLQLGVGGASPNVGVDGVGVNLSVPQGAGASAVLADHRADNLLRLAFKDEVTVDNEFSIRDTIFTNADDFRKYVVHHGDEVRKSLSPDPVEAQRLFDDCLEKAQALEKRKDLQFILRRQLTPQAGNRYNDCKTLASMLESDGTSSESRIAELHQEAADVLASPSSWDVCMLLINETNFETKSIGATVVASAAIQDGASGIHRLSTWSAHWWAPK